MKAAIVPILALALAGCAWESPQDSDRGDLQFEKGVTTQSEVTAKLGQPNETSWLPDGTVVDVYRFVSIAGPSKSAGAPRSRVITATFNSSGKLLSYSNTES